MRVHLSGGERGVPQEFLYGAKIRPTLQQVGGERVAEGMGRDSSGGVDGGEMTLETPTHVRAGERSAATAHEDAVVTRSDGATAEHRTTGV